MSLLHHWLVPALWAAWMLTWCALCLYTRKGTRLEGLQSRLLHFSIIGCAVTLVAVPQTGPLAWRMLPPGQGSFFTGTALVLAGMGFTVWARIHLGRYWSGALSLKKGHRLIRTGPYALVRHPIYTGIIIAMAGTAVTLGELRGALAVVLFTVAYIRKIVIEERALAREFGREHARYRKQVKALIPFIV